jgi:uracil-DNA glycosylase
MKTRTMMDDLNLEIEQHPSNVVFQELGYKPLFSASPTAKIVIIGQAPGKKAQQSGIVWNDASGERLISWLGITPEIFRDPAIIAHLPMDFYYPGKGVSGDLPPRKDFARLWHTRILQQMPLVELTILIGQYAQKYYVGSGKRYNLTEMVRNHHDYLPNYFPIVHPSPLNFRWLNKNQWFEKEVIPALQARISQILMS